MVHPHVRPSDRRCGGAGRGRVMKGGPVTTRDLGEVPCEGAIDFIPRGRRSTVGERYHVEVITTERTISYDVEFVS
jgi:hypothetical protein